MRALPSASSFIILLALLQSCTCLQARSSCGPLHRAVHTTNDLSASTKNDDYCTSANSRDNNTPSKIKLTYFDVEARAEPVRLALTLAQVPFEDERIMFTEWGELKPKTPFGQLPVLSIDDGPPRGQSGAHLRWIGTDLCPSLYPKDRVLDIEEAIGLVEDFSVAFRPSLYLSMRSEAFGHPEGWSKSEEGQKVIKELREKFVKEQLPLYLGYLTAMLEKNDNQWLASKDGPTIADCVAVPALRMFTFGNIDHVPVDCLDGYPAIVSYIKRFCALPQIAGRYDKGLH